MKMPLMNQAIDGRWLGWTMMVMLVSLLSTLSVAAASTSSSFPVIISSNPAFKPLQCFKSTSDQSKCLFSATTSGSSTSCATLYDFSSNSISAVDMKNYDGDPSSADFVIENGSPFVRDGLLYTPLLPASAAPGSSSNIATILSTTRFLNYGSFEARFAACNQSSTVTTFISISNIQDELDYELVYPSGHAGNENRATANWFYQAVPDYSVNENTVFLANSTTQYLHTYGIDYNSDNITWYADGRPFKRLIKANMGLNATRYPKPPMRIQFGIWHDAIANDWAGQDTNINFNAQPAVKFEYIRVLPADCAGGGLEGAFARFDQQQQQQQSNSSSSSSSSSSINNNTNNKNSTYNGDTGGGGNSSTAKNDGNCRNRVEALSLIICSLAAFIPLL